MFTESTYINQQNKQQPMYFMNRDGFTLLAMGFTGKKALQSKLEGEELKELRVTFGDLQISQMTRTLYLWTKRGAARHAKMLIFSFLPAAFCDFFTASNDAAFLSNFLKISLQARFDGARDIGERSTGHWGTEHGTLGNGARDIGERLKAQKCAENPHHF